MRYERDLHGRNIYSNSLNSNPNGIYFFHSFAFAFDKEKHDK